MTFELFLFGKCLFETLKFFDNLDFWSTRTTLLQEVFLEMIYTGSCEGGDLEEHAASLLVLGEKYQVIDIKEKALDILRQRMSHTNVADLLTLSDVHNAPELKDDVMDYIISQWDKVRETEAWKELRNTHPALVEQLFDRLHTPKRQKTTSGTSAAC